MMSRFVAALVLTVGLVPLAESAENPPITAKSELRDLVSRFSVDLDALGRRYPVDASPERFQRLERFYDEWAARVEAVDFEPLGVDGRIDHVLLRNRIAYEKKLLLREQRFFGQAADLLPFANEVLALNDARLRMETMDAPKAGAELAALANRVETMRKDVEKRVDSVDKLAAFRAQERLTALGEALRSWYDFYAGYDPLFTWWSAAPYRELIRAIDGYRSMLRERVLDIAPEETEPIVGTPIGRGALVSDLASELIPYTPEELVSVAEREFAWCEEELRKAAREMGLGDDIMAAIEKVKTLGSP